MTDKPDVWFPIVVGDYLKDTSRLTTEQHGAYLLILMDYWVNGPPLDDDDELAAMARLDAKRWKPMRAKLLSKYFRIEDGRWRNKRIDLELARWSEKKRVYAERAAAGGRAKAAKSSASSSFSSTTKALLNRCTSSASGEVEGPNGPSTLSGQVEFLGPSEVLADFTTALGSEWVASYLAPCGWQDVPERALIPATRLAGTKIARDGRAILAKLGLTVLERTAA